MATDWNAQLGLNALEQQYGLPEGWLLTQLHTESAGNPNAVSPAGAKGLFQFMDGTAGDLGIDPLDPQQAAEGAARYNAQLFKKYDGDPARVAAAYNWGMGNVDRKGLDAAPEETRNYIQKFASFINPVSEAQAAEGNPFDQFDAPQQGASTTAQGNPFDAFDDVTDAGTVYPQDRQTLQAPEDSRPQLGRDLTPLEGLVAPTINALGDFGIPVGNELAGVGGGLRSVLTGGDWKTGFDKGYDYADAIERRLEEQHPDIARMSSAAGQALGGGALKLAEALPFVANSANAIRNWSQAGRLNRAAVLAGTGAAAGAGSGYLAAEGDDRLPSAITGGIVGGIAAPVVSGAVGAVGDRLASASNQAGGKIAAAFDAVKGYLPWQTDAEKLATLRAGRDATVAAERIDPTLQSESPLNVPPLRVREPTFAEQYGNQPIMDYANGGTLHNSAISSTPPAAVVAGPQPQLKGWKNGWQSWGTTNYPSQPSSASTSQVSQAVQRLSRDPQPLSEQLRTEGKALYKAASDRGGVLSSKVTDKWLDQAQGIKPKTAAGRIIAGGDGPADQLLVRIESLRGKALDLESAQDIDEELGKLLRRDSFTDRFGKMNDDGRKVYELQSSLREIIDNADAADVAGGKEGFALLKEARKLWSRQARAREIESILARADGRDNPATIIKNGFQTLKNNPRRLKGYTLAERKLISQAAETGIIGEGLRLLGSRLNAIGALAGGGPAASAAMFGIGLAGRQGAETLAARRGARVLDEIASPGARKRLRAPARITPSVTTGANAGMISANEKDR